MGAQVAHTYASAGTYQAILTVASSNGLSDETSVQIDVQPAEPTASFTASPTSGLAPIMVVFDASASSVEGGHSISAYNWDFGDGATGSGAQVSHAFTTAGIYTVTLVVNSSNARSDTTTKQITVFPSDPVAAINALPVEGMAPLTVAFDGSASLAPEGKAITSYDWAFGDGENGSGVTTSHVFVDAGDFTVTLTVTDENGNTDEETVQIQVEARPESHELHVAAITLQTSQGSDQLFVTQAIVTVNDEYELPVAGVQVGGLFSGDVLGEGSGTTNEAGIAYLLSNAVETMPASPAFCVKSVSYTGLTYTPAQNADPKYECITSNVGIEDPSAIPESYGISNFPNPFHRATTFLLKMPSPGYVSLRIFNVLGQEVAQLADGQKSAGVHRITFDASGLSHGIYIYTLEKEGYKESRKMVLR